MMNKQDILKKIGNIINELNEQHQYLSSTSKINILELELFTANADFLIDHIEILKKINNNTPEIAAPIAQPIEPKEIPASYTEDLQEEVLPEPEEPIEVVFDDVNNAEKDSVQQEEVAEIEEETPKPLFKFDFEEPSEMVFDFEKKIEVEDVFDRELTEEEQRLLEDKKRILTAEEQEERVDIPNEFEEELEEEELGEEPFIIQKTEEVLNPVSVPTPSFKSEQEEIKEPEASKTEKVLSLNEILSNKLEKSPSHLKPITDLKSSISLNDKMLFIKELFNGYNLAYSEAIEILNRFDSFEAADNFLMKNYAEKNNWAAKQATVDRLYEILNRKFKS